MLALLLLLAVLLLVLFIVVVRTVIGLVLLLVIAGLCGAAAEYITGYRTGNIVYTVALGLIGAAIGSLIARLLDLPGILSWSIGGLPVLLAILGAVLLLFLLKLLRPRALA